MNFVQQCTQLYIYIYKSFKFSSKEKYWIMLMNNSSMTILWGKKNPNAWFVNGKTFVVNTITNKKYFSYLKPLFHLKYYIVQFCFQYIISLLITFNLDTWGHIIYPHKKYISGS